MSHALVMVPPRYCRNSVCGKRLARMNRGEYCFACARAIGEMQGLERLPAARRGRVDHRVDEEPCVHGCGRPGHSGRCKALVEKLAMVAVQG